QLQYLQSETHCCSIQHGELRRAQCRYHDQSARNDRKCCDEPPHGNLEKYPSRAGKYKRSNSPRHKNCSFLHCRASPLFPPCSKSRCYWHFEKLFHRRRCHHFPVDLDCPL